MCSAFDFVNGFSFLFVCLCVKVSGFVKGVFLHPSVSVCVYVSVCMCSQVLLWVFQCFWVCNKYFHLSLFLSVSCFLVQLSFS